MKHIIQLCLAGMALMACAGNSGDAEKQEYTTQGDTVTIAAESAIAHRIKIARVEKKQHRAVFTTSGIVKAIPTGYAEIASPFAGRITKSYVRLGQKVAKGSPVFAISSPAFFETAKTYSQARQEMQLALKNLHRERDLYAHKVGVQKELEEAEANYELRKKDYENALAALRVFNISEKDLVPGRPLIVRAPISGEVVANRLVMGQYLKEDAEPVAIIADLNKVWVAANVKEKDMPLVSRLAKVEVSLVSLPGKTIAGSIFHISEMLNEETRAVEILIECDNRSREMKPGMYGTVTLTGAPVGAIMIPTSAILQREDNPYVLLSLGNGRYLKRKVTVSATSGGQSIVESGLNPGDEIVAEGAFYLIEAV